MSKDDGPACLPGFLEHLEGFDEGQLRRHDGAVYGLLPDLTLAYMNPAWFRFARENGGQKVLDEWGLGAQVLDATSGPVRVLYDSRLHRCLKQQESWRTIYECSSSELQRRFQMEVRPLRAGHGLIVHNTLQVEAPRDAAQVASPPDETLYTDDSGLIVQCSYCRRVQRAADPKQWDWVPEWVRDLPSNVTGGLCPPCYRNHFVRRP